MARRPIVMRACPIALVLLVTLMLPTGLAFAQDTATGPHRLVRTLQLLQDKLAFGHIDAHDAQMKLLAHIGEAFARAEPSAWSDPRNARAAVVYLLSGGHPQVIRGLLDRKALDAGDKLLLGALAYVEGREAEAYEAFKEIDPRALPPSLGGQIALVQSALLVRRDAKAALQRLDDARLLLPGTLVDEAALRRQIFLAGQTDDFDKFEWLAVHYIRRYRNSIYAGNFRQRFALAVTRFSFAQEAGNFPRLAAILDHLDVPSRRTLYLLIARTAVVRGKPQMARLAADQAVLLADAGSAEKERARLYRAAALVVTDKYETGLAELGDIAAAQLTGRDLDLLDAARTLARQVRKPLPDAAAPAAADADGKLHEAPATPPAPPRLDVKRSDEALARARKALGELDVLLKEKTR